MKWRMLGRFWFRLLAALLACAAAFEPILLSADQVPVRHMEGLMHGFLALRTLDGRRLADGEMTQIAEGDRVTSRLIFRFKDGSVYDDTTIFSQQGAFRVLSDHLVQRGPSFKQPLETSIDASSGQVIVRYKDKDGKEKTLKQRAEPASRYCEWITVYPRKTHPAKCATHYSIHGGDHSKATGGKT